MSDELIPIEKALNAVGGKQTELAKRLGCTPQNIYRFKRKGKIPTNNPDLWVQATGLSKSELFPEFH